MHAIKSFMYSLKKCYVFNEKSQTGSSVLSRKCVSFLAAMSRNRLMEQTNCVRRIVFVVPSGLELNLGH